MQPPPPAPPIYINFLGTWHLIPESCQYMQGAAPIAGRERIWSDEGVLTIDMAWTDPTGREHAETFRGVPGGPQMTPAGTVADAITLTAPTPRELTITGTVDGAPRLVAQRQLDDTGSAMRLIQQVRFAGGDTKTNMAVYRKEPVRYVH